MTLPVAILAGGLAARLRPLSDNVPKALVEVAGRPFAEHQLRLLGAAGFTDVVFCVGHLGTQVASVLGDGRRFGMRLRYVADGPRLLGTGGALKHALPMLGPRFMVLYGDSYLECDYQAVAGAFATSGRPGLMAVFRNENQWEPSNVRFEAGRVLAYDKRRHEPRMAHIDYGLGALDAGALAPYAANEPLDLEQVYQDLLAADQLAGYEVSQPFHEIGSLDGLRRTREYLTRIARMDL